MTYAVSFMLMAAGFILLIWTVAAAMRFRREREEGWTFVPDIEIGAAESCSVDYAAIEHAERMQPWPTLRGVDWYDLQRRADYGTRRAPDLGGFTEVPLQLRDPQDNRIYVRKRIWMN